MHPDLCLHHGGCGHPEVLRGPLERSLPDGLTEGLEPLTAGRGMEHVVVQRMGNGWALPHSGVSIT